MSVTEAARENNVTQSAISQGISQLEKILNVSLLTHKRNSIKVTHDGEVVFKWSQTLFGQIEELKFHLNANKNVYIGEVTFACSHSLGISILPTLLNEFGKIAPKVTPKVRFGHTGLIKSRIKQGDIEFGFLLDNDDLSSLSLELIYSGAFRFFSSALRANDLSIESCIFPPPRVEVHLIKQLFFKKFGYEIKTDMEICSWLIIAKLLESSPGIGFLPDYLAFDSNKLTFLQPIEMDLFIPYQLYAAYPIKEELSRNAKLFLTITRQIFNDSNVIRHGMKL